MLLTLDAGNSEVTAGLFDGELLVRRWRVATNLLDDPDTFLTAQRAAMDTVLTAVRAVCIASVVPHLNDRLQTAARKLSSGAVCFLSASSALPLQFEVEQPEGVGADRIANALAVFTRHIGDAVIVDLGTATTCDCVTADGRFLGGAIAPGVRGAMHALAARGAQLAASDLIVPDVAIGRTTDEAIRSGVLLGVASMVDGLVERMRAEWPTPGRPRCVATGGFAALIAPHSAVIEAVDQDLTLSGLKAAANALGLAW